MDIRSAPVISPGQRVEGNLAAFNNNRYFSYYDAEFFKISLRAGDRVQLRAESAGDVVPCAHFYMPGTDDFNIDYERRVDDVEYNAPNQKRLLAEFTAGASSTYVFAMSNNTSGCPTGSRSERWAYAFDIRAPHALRLLMPRDTSVRSGQRFSVRALGALSVPVTEPKLAVGLFGVWGSAKPKKLGQGTVRGGKVTFTLRIPSSLKGKKIRLIANAGDNAIWVAARASRSYLVR